MITTYDINQIVYFESDGVRSGVVKEIRIDSDNQEKYLVECDSVKHLLNSEKLKKINELNFVDMPLVFFHCSSDYYYVMCANNVRISIGRAYGVCCVDFSGSVFAKIKKSVIGSVMKQTFDYKSINDLVYFNHNCKKDMKFIQSLIHIDSNDTKSNSKLETPRFIYSSIAKNFIQSINPKISKDWLNGIEDEVDSASKSKSKLWLGQFKGNHNKYRFDITGEYLVTMSEHIVFDFKTINILGIEWEFTIDPASKKIITFAQMGDLSPTFYCYKISSLILADNITYRLGRLLELAQASNVRVESLTEGSVICSGDYGIDQDKYREED